MTFVTGLVLAAGGSKRLGQPKQLLPFGEEHVARPRAVGRAMLSVRPGAVCDRGGGPEVRGVVDLDGFEVVDKIACSTCVRCERAVYALAVSRALDALSELIAAAGVSVAHAFVFPYCIGLYSAFWNFF